MQPNHTLRLAQPSDAPQLAVLANQVFLATYASQGISAELAQYVLAEFTPQRFDELLADSEVHIFVAERSAALLGFCTLRRNAPCPIQPSLHCELQTLYVSEYFVGQGIGSALLAQAQSVARHGVPNGAQHSPQSTSDQALWLTVNASNARAIGFYTHHAMVQLGTWDFVLGDTAHTNWVMVG